MLKGLHVNGFTKEVLFTFVTLTVYILVGASRSYFTFLFYQLDFHESIIKITDEQKSWIATSIGILSPIGCIISGSVMDYCGRKTFLFLMFIPFIISWLIIAFSRNFSILFLGMLVQGFGAGMSFCVTTYISEITTVDHRGPLLGIMEIAYNVGVFFCTIFMYNLSWNTVAFIFAGFAVVSLSFVFVLPESPIWLFSRGRYEQSIDTLCRMRCTKKENIEDEIKEMENFCKTQVKRSVSTSFKNCLKNWRIFALVFSLFVLIQHTGYSIMVAYTIMILNRLSIPFDSTRITVTYAAVGFVGSVLTPFFMHKMNRKTLLGMSAFGMGICMLVVAVYEEIFYLEDEKPYAWIIPAVLYVYTMACNIGVLPISLTIGGEIFPQEVSGTMNGLFGVFCYGYWAITLKVYPEFMFYFGIKCLIWAFTVSCLIVSLFAILILPETRGKSLNEVQEQYFRKKKDVENDGV